MTRRGLFAMLGALMAPKRALKNWLRYPVSIAPREARAPAWYPRAPAWNSAVIASLMSDPNWAWIECFLLHELPVVAVAVEGVSIPRCDMPWPAWWRAADADYGYSQRSQQLRLCVPAGLVRGNVPRVEVMYDFANPVNPARALEFLYKDAGYETNDPSFDRMAAFLEQPYGT